MKLSTCIELGRYGGALRAPGTAATSWSFCAKGGLWNIRNKRQDAIRDVLFTWMVRRNIGVNRELPLLSLAFCESNSSLYFPVPVLCQIFPLLHHPFPQCEIFTVFARAQQVEGDRKSSTPGSGDERWAC